MTQKQKAAVAIFCLSLLGASCNPFKNETAAGILKSVNGGADWQFSNTYKDDPEASLQGLGISKLEFDPTNRNIIFASSYQGGIYKSEDAAGSWTRILSKILVYDFTINDTNTKNIFAAGSFGSFGKLLKTTDGGSIWDEVYSEQGGNTIRAVSLNPANPNQLLIGTSSGNLLKSNDSGLTWQLLKDFQDRTQDIIWNSHGVFVLTLNKGLFKVNPATGEANSLTDLKAAPFSNSQFSLNAYGSMNFHQTYVDALSGNLMYLSSDAGLFKSLDQGKTWQTLTLPVKASEGRVRAVAASRVSSNIVYANIGPTIYKSTDGGITWQTQSLQISGFVNQILIDPELSQIVYVGVYPE
jgi:photosystem II stability/assembly factor-like uncharacterized protein